MPRVLNIKALGQGATTWNLPREFRYVGRSTPFGNPYRIGRDGTRVSVVVQYVRWLSNRPDVVDRVRRELGGYDLVCHCMPDLCHGEVLEIVANADERWAVDPKRWDRLVIDIVKKLSTRGLAVEAAQFLLEWVEDDT